jgi:hypothetical protein
MRPSGVWATAQSWKLEPMKPALREPSVSTMPGLTEFTRMPLGPSAAALTQVFGRFPTDQQQAEHINVEYRVKMLLSDLFERLHLVYAGIVDQHVETAKSFDRGVDNGEGVGRL